MSVLQRFTAIALTFAFVGACAASDSGVEHGGGEAVLQQERLKFLVLFVTGTGRGPWLMKYDEEIEDYSTIQQIDISYSNATVRKAFDDALTNEIISRNLGKRAICDCEGRFIDGGKGREFEVSSFTIYFEDISPELR